MAWYAAFVLTGHEDSVCQEINRYLAAERYDGVYELLVPKRKLMEWHPEQGGFIEVIRTMFPGYVLIQSEEIRDFNKNIQGCRGLFRLLQSESGFSEIRLEEIAVIIYMTDEDGVIGSSDILAEGSYVEVISGPLKGHDGLIKKIDRRKHRAKVLFKFDGGEHLIELAIRIANKP